MKARNFLCHNRDDGAVHFIFEIISFLSVQDVLGYILVHLSILYMDIL